MILSALLAGNVRRITVDLDPELELPRSHPFVEADRMIAAEFGGRNPIVIAVVPHRGTTWTAEALELLHRLTRSVLDLPGVIRNNVVSLAAPAARRVITTHGRIEERYLMPEPPTTAEEIDGLRAAYEAVPMYRGLLVSEDERASLLFADFWSTEEALDGARRILDLADRLSTPAIAIRVTGAPIIQLTDRRNLSDMPQYAGLAFCLIAFVLWIAFRSLQGAVVPLATGLLSVLWDLGLMALADIPLTTWNSSVPILVLAVAAAHSTQMVRRYHEIARTACDSRRAVVDTLRTMGPVMLATGGTTAGGFAALAIFRLPSLTRFGLAAALGIISAVILELTFIPAVRSLLPLPVATGHARTPFLFAHRLSAFVLRRPAAITETFVAISVIAVLAVPSVPVGGSTRRYLPEGSRAREDLEAISRHFRGTVTMNVLLRAPRGEVLSPASVQTMQRIQNALSSSSQVASSTSAADVLRETYRTFLGREAEDLSLPHDSRTLAQIGFLASGSLERFVDRTRSRAVIWAYLERDDAETVAGVLDHIEADLRTHPPPPEIDVALAGGTAPLMLAVNEHTAKGKAVNACLLMALIALVAAGVFRSLAVGLLVVIPLVTTGVLSLGLLAARSLHLDVVTVSVISVGIAIGADYAIYMMYRWREELRSGSDLRAGLSRTFASAGSAIVFVAAAITAGFLSLATSPYLAFRLASQLIAFSTVVSALAALLLLPAVALLWRPPALFAERQTRPSSS